jgi:hypothetical protein
MSLVCRSVFCAIPAQAVFCARQGWGCFSWRYGSDRMAFWRNTPQHRTSGEKKTPQQQVRLR